ANAITAVINLNNAPVFLTQAAIYQLTSASALPVAMGRMVLSNPTQLSYNMPPYSVSTLNLSAAPMVTAVSPNSGPTGGGTSVAITGSNLAGTTAVGFGGNPANAFTVNSATSISATAPAGRAGTVHVTVTTPGGTSAISAADQFTYAAAATV